MTFDEKMELAVRMRNSRRFKAIDQEEFDKYPASEVQLTIATSAGETNAYLISPADLDERSPIVINFHGGGFINKRLDRDKLFCFKLTCALNCKVLDVDYKLSPEFVYPTALNESYDILTWVGDNFERLSIASKRINLIGHSAGGNLVVGVIAKALENNRVLVDKMVLDYAPLDLLTDPELKPRFERDMPAYRAKAYNAFYCKTEERKLPGVSPLYLAQEKLKGFPKTLMIMAGEDSLAEEGVAFSEKLIMAGVDVQATVFANCVHGFTINRMDRHEEAFDMIVSFLE